GHLIISTPYHGYLKNLFLALTNSWDAHLSPFWDGGHIKFWSYKTLSRLLNESGFRIVRFIGAGRLPFLWKSMIVVAQKREAPEQHTNGDSSGYSLQNRSSPPRLCCAMTVSGFAKSAERQTPRLFGSGGKGIRTPGLLIANETLYQLSYTPVYYRNRLRS